MMQQQQPPPAPPPLPELLDLLQRQPPARRQRIAQRWGSDDPSPLGLYRFITEDADRARALLDSIEHTPESIALLTDMVQEHGLPVALYPEDQQAKNLLSAWGLIYPYPPEWDLHTDGSQWHWIMPVELAILCAPSVELYRFSLPLMLGCVEDPTREAILDNMGLPHSGSVVFDALHVNLAMSDRERLANLLLDPEWYEHIFTLQILLEWHGVCHRHELFSFAWGDDTIRPLAGRAQQRREQRIEGDLTCHGLIFIHRPPLLPDQEVPDELVVLPEELRPTIWHLNRELIQQSVQELLIEAGGWTHQPRNTARPLTHEPVDLLKAIICLQDSGAIALDAQGALTPEANARLDALAPEAPWQHLVNAGLRLQALATTPQGAIIAGGAASRLLDQGPDIWSLSLLQRWVEGTGNLAMDTAQNMALGITQQWLDEVAPLLDRLQHRQEPLECWWHMVDPNGFLHPPPPRPPSGTRRRRNPMRPPATWLRAPGSDNPQDIQCGYPRQEPERDLLENEVLLTEGVVQTFKLLLLDLLGGLSTTPFPLWTLRALLQDTASLAVHLNLPAMFFDSGGQTFIPLRPPTYLAEELHEPVFSTLAQTLLDELLIPAGAADIKDDLVRVFAHRLLVHTPRWTDHAARTAALASVVGEQPEDLSDRPAPSTRLLRDVGATGESEQRVWLGRPLEELRRAVAGRQITAIHDGYLEVQ